MRIIFCALVLTVSLFGGRVERNGVTFFTDDTQFVSEITNGGIDEIIALIKTHVVQMGRISGVQKTYIVQVISSLGSVENVIGKVSTSKDHGGAMFARTLVIGYGGESYDSATFDGQSATQLSSVGFDMNLDRVIDGWIDSWNISNIAGSGVFTFKARSMNGTNFLSSSLQIR